MAQRKLKAVIFDMDGVLVDSEWQVHLRLKRFLSQNNIIISGEILLQTIGMTRQGIAELVSGSIGTDWTPEEYHRRYAVFAGNEGPISFRGCVNPGAEETLSAIRAQGCRLALASSSPREAIERMLAECGFEHAFEAVLSGEEIRRSKPNPEIYDRAAELLGVEPSACMAVEDSQYGIDAALGAGMLVVAKRPDKYSIRQEGTHYIVDELPEILPLLEMYL